MGLRTLVLGAYHYCWYDKCRYFNGCVMEGRAADYDTVCPEYEQMSDRDYYRLSNSNVIEIDSYLEGEHYPAYDSFTHRMLGKKSFLGSDARASFWEKVAFYNWIQHYLPGPVEDFSYDRWEPVFMQDLPAFEDVLRELRPHAVLVWTEPLRQFLDRHCASLEGISLVRTGVIEMEALEAWEYRVGYEGEPVRPVRRNKAQFRTFRAIVCVGEDEDIVRLIDNIRRNVAAGSGKRGLTIDDIQQFLGTDIRHVPQMLYRLRMRV